jgi:enoyl-CoA hydratase/carnithine racemase
MIGLVSHRADAGSLDEKLGQVVAALLAKPPEALRLTQSLLRHGARDEVLERMKLESGLFAERLASAEVKEAISAFFEKRKPAWQAD